MRVVVYPFDNNNIVKERVDSEPSYTKLPTLVYLALHQDVTDHQTQSVVDVEAHDWPLCDLGWVVERYELEEKLPSWNRRQIKRRDAYHASISWQRAPERMLERWCARKAKEIIGGGCVSGYRPK